MVNIEVIFCLSINNLRKFSWEANILNIFKNIWSFLFPAIKTIAPHAMRAGADFVEDIGTGTNWRESAMKHGSTVVKQIPDAISAGVAARRNQSGSGYRRRQSKRAKGLNVTYSHNGIYS